MVRLKAIHLQLESAVPALRTMRPGTLLALCLLAVALAATGCGRKVYDNPITKDTLQPDKVLFDKAIADMGKGATKWRGSR